MRAAVDTNILAYAEGVDGPRMQETALDLLWGLPPGAACVPAQVIAELFNLLVKKDGQSPVTARKAARTWQAAYPIIATSTNIIDLSIEAAVEHRLGIWDAIVLASAAASGCALLLSEDLQNGFSWRGVTVVNPFTPIQHRLLHLLLNS